MQLLGFREPSGRVFIIDEINALPPLAEGYEWTMVVHPERTQSAQGADNTSTPAQAESKAPAEQPGIFDVLLKMLTPSPGQTPHERGVELIGMLPADLRRNLTILLRAVLPQSLPPFPRG